MQAEIKKVDFKKADFTICPYCNGEMVDGKCEECGWRPEYECSRESANGMVY